MTTSIPQGTLLDVLKKKMRQTKEEMEKYKDECEEFHKRLQLEVVRREEVSSAPATYLICYPLVWANKRLRDLSSEFCINPT